MSKRPEELSRRGRAELIYEAHRLLAENDDLRQQNAEMVRLISDAEKEFSADAGAERERGRVLYILDGHLAGVRQECRRVTGVGLVGLENTATALARVRKLVEVGPARPPTPVELLYERLAALEKALWPLERAAALVTRRGDGDPLADTPAALVLCVGDARLARRLLVRTS